MAKMFLAEVRRRSNHYAERIDPSRKRSYEKDPLLKALDGIASMASRTLDAIDPKWREEEN